MIRRYLLGILLGTIICIVVGLTPAEQKDSVPASQPETQPATQPTSPLLPILDSEITEQYIPAGSDDILWLLKINQANFDILARKLGKDWQWAAREMTPANPRCPVAAGEKLHVFFEGGTYVFFSFPTNELANMSVGANTPGNVVAACPTKDFLTQPGPGLLVAIQQRTSAIVPFAKTQPAAKRDANQNNFDQVIVIYRFTGSQWVETARLAGDFSEKQQNSPSIFLAELEDTIFLLTQTGGSFSLLAKDPNEQPWRKLSVAFDEFPGKPIGLQVIKDKLVCVFATDEGILKLGIFDTKPARFASPQTIKLNDSPAKLGQAVQVTRLADQLVLRWQEKGNAKIATCTLTGSINNVEDIKQKIDEMPDASLANNLREYAVLGIVVIFVLTAFTIKPKNSSPVFMLPATLRPGNLVKRFIAFLLDFVPFLILGMTIFVPDMLNKELDELRPMLENPEKFQTVELVYAQLFSLGLYIVYCIAMEMRFGATVGKMAFKLKVVEADGNKPGIRSAVLRNITKAIELPMLAGHQIWFMVIIFMLPVITRYNQRLGDMVARSAVVDSRELPIPVVNDNNQPADEKTDESTDDN